MPDLADIVGSGLRRLVLLFAGGLPKRIPIAHDDYHARHVGRLADGRQFFATTPFIPAIGPRAGREFLAVYVFDADGRLLEARIDDLGVRKDVDEDAARALLEKRIEALGPLRFGNIAVRPFSVERFDTTFGLIPCDPEDAEEGWFVELHPGDHMSFHPPWDGTYDT
jgi:hypothetical protein